jgi:transcriptional regulator with XRE-family HTH domain
MRRMMLGLSRRSSATGSSLTFQQVQKYEKGANRIGASRLQQIATILQVPVAFFFEGAAGGLPDSNIAPSPAYVSDFLATSDGLALVKAFQRIPRGVRRSIVDLVRELAGEESDDDRPKLRAVG